jgi:CRP-like cAMP-binding protein
MEHPTGNLLLATLPQADFSLLSPHLRKVTLVRDAILAHSGRASQIYFPCSGLITWVMEMPDGQVVATSVIGNDGAEGILASLMPSPSPVTAVVRLPGTALRISAERFHSALRRSAAIAQMIEIFAGALIAQLQHVAACNALHPVDGRIGRWLLHLHDHVEDDSLPVTQEALAELLGVRRPTVTQVVNKLKSSGAIRRNRRGQIEIDRSRLEAASCPCYEAIRRIHHAVVKSRDLSHARSEQEVSRGRTPNSPRPRS